MVGLIRGTGDRGGASGWLSRAAQALDEHHLVAWSRNLSTRERFGLEMAWFLQRLPQAQTCVINGAIVRDLDSLCRQLERALPRGEPMARSIDGRGGVIDRLRSRSSEAPIRGEADVARHRYYVWRDAEVLLRSDPSLFERVVDAITGVAAEAEFASEDRLLIHRAVFIGGPGLDVHAEREDGPFQRWHSDRNERPLWSVVSGLAAPPVMRYAI
ncbi:MAG: hypothetical protein AB7K52_09070 [Phycisphaerales bacterium]